MRRLRGVAAGAGYFSTFHLDAWSRLAGVEMAAVCDLDPVRAEAVRTRFGLPRRYGDVRAMLDTEQPDFLDIITPPGTHLDLVRAAAERGVHVVCQKPLAPSLEDARLLVETAAAAGVRLMVHENFRFQPWHREIHRLLRSGVLGTKLHTLTFRTRTGDGWGPAAYLDRQPYFRAMPRLLIYETGIHFIDTFRFLAGEVASVFCHLRRLNPVIQGEDCGLMLLSFQSGAIGVWDANRWNEPPSTCADPRYTLGEFLVETEGGSIRLAADGTLTIQELGGQERRHNYHHERRGFGGDCVYATLKHFRDRLLDGAEFETEGRDYLRNLVIQEALYRSAERGSWCPVP